jgi:hypothetical protein
MILFLLLAMIVTANLVIGVVAAAQVGIGPGLNGLLNFRVSLRLFRRRTCKAVALPTQVHLKLIELILSKKSKVAQYECRYARVIPSILDQLNASVAKLPWIASELEYFCRVLDGRYRGKMVRQQHITEALKNALQSVERIEEMFDIAFQIEKCPRALNWIWDFSKEPVEQFKTAAKNYEQNSQDQKTWLEHYERAVIAVCQLSDALQMNWRLAVAKCYEAKPHGQNWPDELFYDPVHPNRHIASALKAAQDDRPMDRTLAMLEIHGLKELNILYGRGVTEAVLDFWLESLPEHIRKSITATIISRSRYLFDVRTLNIDEFTRSLETLRANIAQSKFTIGKLEINLRATVTIATMDTDIRVSTAISKIRSLHEQSKKLGSNQSWFHADGSVNPLLSVTIDAPINHAIVDANSS